jgi:hypothetical protein
MDLKQTGWEDMNLIHLVSQKRRICLVDERLLASEERLCSVELVMMISPGSLHSIYIYARLS